MKKNQNNKFKTPEGYFESFNDRLMQRLNEDSDSQSDIIPKTDGFRVPDRYFEKLNESVSNRLQENDTKVVRLNTNRKWYYAAAAIAALMVITFVWNTEKAEIVQFNDLAQNEITDYFEDTDFELSSYEIAEMLPVEDIAINDITESTWDNDQVLDYLEEHIDDFDELNLDFDELEE